MKKLHERLLEKSRAYFTWHEDPMHTMVHWFAFFSVAVVAAVFLQFNILSEVSVESQIASPFSAGKVLGVSENRLIVGFYENVQQPEKVRMLKEYGLKERGNIPQLGMHVYQITGAQTAQEVATLILSKESALVEFAEPDYLIEPSVIPNDPWYSNWQKNKQQIGAPLAWDTETNAGGVVVAVLDTGIACAHEDLAANCVSGKNMIMNSAGSNDTHGHGTAVAGVIGAVGNNGVGVAGGVWATKLMPIVVSETNGAASYSTIASAISYAADNGARVVNNSYQSGGSAAVQRAAKYLWGKGGVLVVAEGNYGKDTGLKANPYIVSVGAVDSQNALYTWSSYGSDVDVVAPGCTGATTAVSGGYGSFCGTSNAAPEVSALVALIFAVNPLLSPTDVVSILTSSASDLGVLGVDVRFGAGLINMESALLLSKTYVPTTSTAEIPKGKQR